MRDVIHLEEAAAAGRNRAGASVGRRGNTMWAAFNIFPLILIPVLIYNITAFAGSALEGAQAVRERMSEQVFAIPMASNVQWIVTWGDVLLLVSLMLLFVELLKSTSTGASAIFNHALSMMVFIVCLVEFLLHPAFATSVFFMIMVMSLLDVLAGVIVTIVSARRDVEFDKGGGGH
jgi:hypothetical protein